MIPTRGAEVELHFLTTEQGGRTEAVSLGDGAYRPHLVVAGGEYLGIVVTQGPSEPVLPGGRAKVTVAFLYGPAVDYSALVEGAWFQVMEGSRVVASGRVLYLVG